MAQSSHRLRFGHENAANQPQLSSAAKLLLPVSDVPAFSLSDHPFLPTAD